MFWLRCKMPPLAHSHRSIYNSIEQALIDTDTIAAKMKHMAVQISAIIQGVDDLILVRILNGAFCFTADL